MNETKVSRYRSRDVGLLRATHGVAARNRKKKKGKRRKRRDGRWNRCKNAARIYIDANKGSITI